MVNPKEVKKDQSKITKFLDSEIDFEKAKFKTEAKKTVTIEEDRPPILNPAKYDKLPIEILGTSLNNFVNNWNHTTWFIQVKNLIDDKVYTLMFSAKRLRRVFQKIAENRGGLLNEKIGIIRKGEGLETQYGYIDLD